MSDLPVASYRDLQLIQLISIDSKRRALKSKGVKLSNGKGDKGDKVAAEPAKAPKLKNKPRPLPETKKAGRKA